MWSKNFSGLWSLGTVCLPEQYQAARADSEQPQTQTHFSVLPSSCIIGDKALDLPNISLFFIDI
jgi:hypothetical protein